MIDNKTPHLSLPLPHADNLLTDDVPRLRAALDLLDTHAAQADANTGQTAADLADVRTVAESAAKTALWPDISGKPEAFPAAAHGHDFSELTGKPTAFIPAAHTHPAQDLTEVIPVAKGGTGRTDGGINGNAATATKLSTARTISLTGGVTGSASFDGSKNISIATTLKNSEIDEPNHVPKSRVYSSVGQDFFIVPSGVTKLLVLCIGGGSAGYTGAGYYSDRGKGGEGGIAASAYVSVRPGDNIPITVAGPGGTSSFGTFLSCNTTQSGNSSPIMTSKAGTGSRAYGPNYTGASGGKGFSLDWYIFATTGGAATNTQGTAASGSTGGAGSPYGGGGGGGGVDSDNDGGPGGSGAQGLVAVFW